MLILADNDVGGAVAALRRILESEEWAEFSAMLALRFVEFIDVGLTRDASDRVVWQTWQEVGAVLITSNRARGDAQRLVRDRAYGERVRDAFTRFAGTHRNITRHRPALHSSMESASNVEGDSQLLSQCLQVTPGAICQEPL